MPLNSSEAMTDVVFHTYPNIYVYTWRRLVLSYGIGVLFTLVCVIIGCYTMLATGESYSHTFSTIVRTTRNSAWDDLIPETERRGQDPLSKHIRKLAVPIGQSWRAVAQTVDNTEGKGFSEAIANREEHGCAVKAQGVREIAERVPDASDQVSLMSNISGHHSA